MFATGFQLQVKKVCLEKQHMLSELICSIILFLNYYIIFTETAMAQEVTQLGLSNVIIWHNSLGYAPNYLQWTWFKQTAQFEKMCKGFQVHKIIFPTKMFRNDLVMIS